MNHATKVTVESKVFEGAKFTVKKLSEGRRVQLRLALAPEFRTYREILEQIEPFRKRLREAKLEPGQDLGDIFTRAERDLFEELSDKCESVEFKISEAWIRWGLVSVENLTLDGEPATVDSLIELAPAALLEEVVLAIQSGAGFTEAQAKNSESPSTSGAVEQAT